MLVHNELLYPIDEGTTILRNVGHYSPSDTTSPKIPESSATPPLEPRISLSVRDVTVTSRSNEYFQSGYPFCFSYNTKNICLGQSGASRSVDLFRVYIKVFGRVCKNCEKRLLASSCLAVCPYFCPHRTPRLPLDGFLWNFVFEIFSKFVEKIHISFKSNKKHGYIIWGTVYTFYHIPLSSS
jgi:hypothetical protein